MVRLDRTGRSSTVNYWLAAPYRGKDWRAMLALAPLAGTDADCVMGRVMPANLALQKNFAHLGFATVSDAGGAML
jgi:hypothetical protein